MKQFDELLASCNETAFDLRFTKAKNWKLEDNSRALVGFLPIYFPREIVHVVNGLAVGIMGAGDHKQIIKGEQSLEEYTMIYSIPL